MKFYRQIAMAMVTVAAGSMFTLSAQAGSFQGQEDNGAPNTCICQTLADTHADAQLNACGGNRRGGHGSRNGNGNGGNGPKNGSGSGLKAGVCFRF